MIHKLQYKKISLQISQHNKKVEHLTLLKDKISQYISSSVIWARQDAQTKMFSTRHKENKKQNKGKHVFCFHSFRTGKNVWKYLRWIWRETSFNIEIYNFFFTTDFLRISLNGLSERKYFYCYIDLKRTRHYTGRVV